MVDHITSLLWGSPFIFSGLTLARHLKTLKPTVSELFPSEVLVKMNQPQPTRLQVTNAHLLSPALCCGSTTTLTHKRAVRVPG
jgi:hypothetical protein